MNQKVWITGSRGFLGSYLIKMLKDLGFECLCISNQIPFSNIVQYVDFSDRTKIRDAIKQFGIPNTFIHLGWGNVYSPHHEDHITTNLFDGINLIDELFDFGLERFIFIGSSSEYGSLVGKLSEDVDLGTTTENNYIKGKTSLCKYGLSKVRDTGSSFLHIRLFYTFGAGQRSTSLLNQLFTAFIEGQSINLSPCSHFRDYIHVSDAALGICKLCSVKHVGILNLGSGEAIKLSDFVRMFWDALGGDPADLLFGKHSLPVTEQSQPQSFADLSKLLALTNWQPSLTTLEGIRLTISEMNNNLSLNN